MSDNFAHVTIRILEKEYQVACPAAEKAALIASAELLNGKMREIRDSGKVVGLDRVAVVCRHEHHGGRPTAGFRLQ